MKVRIYSALPEKEKQVLFELVQECNKVDGGYRLPYLDNNYNADPEMPAFFLAEMDGRTIGFYQSTRMNLAKLRFLSMFCHRIAVRVWLISFWLLLQKELISMI